MSLDPKIFIYKDERIREVPIMFYIYDEMRDDPKIN